MPQQPLTQSIVFNVERYSEGDSTTLEDLRGGQINALGDQFIKQIQQIQQIYNKALNETKERFVKSGATPLLY